MNTSDTTTTAGAQPENVPTEEIAKLNRRVRRQPPSLANYHYHLEPGTKVYVLHRGSDGFALVSTVPQEHRCSEDAFRVSGLALI